MSHFCIRWYKGCSTPQDKKDRKEFVFAHLSAIKMLQSLIEDDISNIRDAHIGKEYVSPSWAYEQADVNGQIKALTRVLELLKIEE